MIKPIIGMVEMGDSLFRLYMKSKYINALSDAGAVVKLLPWAETAEDAHEQLSDCTGLLIPGGADVSPALYGETPHAKCGKPHEKRDIAEPLYIKEAVQRGIPVLGICRGMQMLNVALGGTLWQDIGLISGTHINHSNFLGRGREVHNVNVPRNGSKLAALCSEVQGVNTIHHQAVNRIADCLTCTATSDDGIIEGIEKADADFVIGVQWHPEHLYNRSDAAKNIFKAFVEVAGKYNK